MLQIITGNFHFPIYQYVMMKEFKGAKGSDANEHLL